MLGEDQGLSAAWRLRPGCSRGSRVQEVTEAQPGGRSGVGCRAGREPVPRGLVGAQGIAYRGDHRRMRAPVAIPRACSAGQAGRARTRAAGCSAWPGPDGPRLRAMSVHRRGSRAGPRREGAARCPEGVTPQHPIEVGLGPVSARGAGEESLFYEGVVAGVPVPVIAQRLCRDACQFAHGHFVRGAERGAAAVHTDGRRRIGEDALDASRPGPARTSCSSPGPRECCSSSGRVSHGPSA